MHADVHSHCHGCLMCASRQGSGKAMKPALTPIPVGGSFHRVGVDILHLPQTVNGHCYIICLLDYLAKWVEAFPIAYQ